MAKYRIQAPDGKTYEIEGPSGATTEQVQAEVIRQNPHLAGGAAPTAQDRARAKYQEAEAARQSGNAKPEYSPTDVPWGENFVAGVGKSFVDLGRGARQLYAGAADAVTGGDRTAAMQPEIDQAAQLDAPLMSNPAGVGGYVGGTLATIAAPGGLLSRGAQAAGLTRTGAALQAVSNPTTYRAAAASGAIQGALQPTATGESRIQNTAIGGGFGFAGNAIANGLGRVGVPFPDKVVNGQRVPRLSAADARAVKTLEGAGVPLDAAQRTGSGLLGVVKSGLKDNFATVGLQSEAVSGQQGAFNRAVLRSIGANSDVADEATMGAARTRIGQVFNDVLGKTKVRFSQPFQTNLQALADRSRRVLPGDANQITRTVDDLLSHAQANGGAIDGRYYNTLRADIGTLESQPGTAPLARELREALDNAFQQAAKGDDAKRLLQARREWRNLKLIEGAIDTEGGGNVSAAKLANQFGQKRNRGVGVYGSGDASIRELAAVAKSGKRLLTDKTPNSGTTRRALAQAALPAAAGAIYGASQGDFGSAVALGLGGIAAPVAMQKALNSRAVTNYLADGIQQPMARNTLLALQQSPLLRLGAAPSAFAVQAQSSR